MNIETTAPHAPFKGLADPTRLRIAMLLSNRELCVCDLTEVLSLPQPSVSRHMANLKSAGLVKDRREGRWIHYRLAETEILNDLRPCFERLRDREPYRGDRMKLEAIQRDKKC